MKKIYLVALTLVSSMNLFGQATFTDSTKSCDYRLMTSLHLGTVGFGLDFKYNSGIHTARLGYSTIPFHYATVIDMGSKLKMGAETKVSYNNIHLIYDLQPFKKADWFRLNAGAAYFVSASVFAKLTPQDSINAKIVSLSPEEIGNVSITVDSKGFAPYLGIGLGRAVPKNRFNVNFDFGTYYLPAPTVTVIGTKLLSNNTSLGTQLTEDLKAYRWMPMLQLNLTYIIK